MVLTIEKAKELMEQTNGNLNLAWSDITSLPDGLTVPGDLNLLNLSNPAKESDLESLYYEYRNQMMSVSIKILHDFSTAEDAVQEALIRIAKHIDDIDMQDSKRTRAYVLTITRNAALTIHKNRQARCEVSLCEIGDVETDEGGPMEWVISRLQEDELRKALQEMPIEQAEVLMLKYAYGYKHKEISAMLNRTEAAVEQQASRGKKRLKALLERRANR